jgi:lysophospholipase L1-like esterase
MIRRQAAAWQRWAAAVWASSALAASAARIPAQTFALKDGETVVFYGDSITAQRLYTKDVEEFVLTRYPALDLHFVNAGVPGDTTQGGYAGTMAERVARDVKPYAPTMITLLLGMNDGGWGYGSPAEIEADFRTRYGALLDALRQAAPEAALTILSPTPYDEMTHGTEFPGYSRMIDRLADDVAAIAAERERPGGPPVLYADLHRAIEGALERAKAQEPVLAPLLIPDRIHPAEAGHWIMASALMKAWHVDPLVSRVRLGASGATVISSYRARVSALQKNPDELEWTQLDEALPLPLDFNNVMTTLAIEISDIGELDREMLEVDGLAQGEYELLIDGKSIARFSARELAGGVNLALLKTPMLSEARGIAGTEDERAMLDQARFILRADVRPLETTETAESTLRTAEGELETKVRGHLKPSPHHFELRQAEAKGLERSF